MITDIVKPVQKRRPPEGLAYRIEQLEYAIEQNKPLLLSSAECAGYLTMMQELREIARGALGYAQPLSADSPDPMYIGAIDDIYAFAARLRDNVPA